MGLRGLEVGLWSPAPLLLNKIQGICSWNILYWIHNASNLSDFPQIQSPDPAQINSVVLTASSKAEESIIIGEDTSIITDMSLN